MALKTLHFVPGLSRTPLLFIPRYYTNIFFENILQKTKISRIDNLKIWKSKKPGSLTSAQMLARCGDAMGYIRMEGCESEWDGVGPHGRGPLGAQRDPMGGDPWEREPLGAKGIPWEETLGPPFGSPLEVRGPIWRYSVMK